MQSGTSQHQDSTTFRRSTNINQPASTVLSPTPWFPDRRCLRRRLGTSGFPGSCSCLPLCTALRVGGMAGTGGTHGAGTPLQVPLTAAQIRTGLIPLPTLRAGVSQIPSHTARCPSFRQCSCSSAWALWTITASFRSCRSDGAVSLFLYKPNRSTMFLRHQISPAVGLNLAEPGSSPPWASA
jgi:hypothetical protein